MATSQYLFIPMNTIDAVHVKTLLHLTPTRRAKEDKPA